MNAVYHFDGSPIPAVPVEPPLMRNGPPPPINEVGLMRDERALRAVGNVAGAEFLRISRRELFSPAARRSWLVDLIGPIERLR